MAGMAHVRLNIGAVQILPQPQSTLSGLLRGQLSCWEMPYASEFGFVFMVCLKKSSHIPFLAIQTIVRLGWTWAPEAKKTCLDGGPIIRGPIVRMRRWIFYHCEKLRVQCSRLLPNTKGPTVGTGSCHECGLTIYSLIQLGQELSLPQGGV